MKMKALVYSGVGKRTLEDRPKPAIKDPTDAVVRILKTSICKAGLHVIKGDVPSAIPGRILGHEGVGVIEQIGTAVSTFHAGDRILISSISACGRCDSCRKGMYSHCASGGWILGNAIDGTQAEYVRIPWADTSLYHIPACADEEALAMLSDTMPTGYECGVLNGKVKPGDSVAIVGAGPVGLASALTAQFYSPADVIMIDMDAHRLEVASQFGATRSVNNSNGEAVEAVMRLTANRGVDVAIEAVGSSTKFDICQGIVAAGGTIANIGIHGKSVDLHLEKLWDRNISLTMGLVDTVSTPFLLKTMVSGRLRRHITHRFRLDEIAQANETFGNAAQARALKVIITND
jgi:alcohol dehydrogenase